MIRISTNRNDEDQLRQGSSRMLIWFFAVSISSLSSCGDLRHFRTHEDAIRHFHRHQSDFEKAAALYLAIGKLEFTPSPPGSSGPPTEEAELTRIAKELSITGIYTVPNSGTPDEQYIEFVLEGKTLQPYGVIFVPPDHRRAMITCRNCLKEGPDIFSVFRDLGRRWFYFEYR